jgi:hypothetical protein
VNRHNVHIWGTKQPHAQIEHQRDSPKVNVFCVVSCEKVHSPFFFTEATVTGSSFLDMLDNWLLHQLNTNYNDYILQLEGAPLIFTRMYECFSIMFFHRAGSDMLQMKTTTSSLGHPIRQILHHAISFFGCSLKTACATIAHAHPGTS